MKLKSGWIQHQWVLSRYWKGSWGFVNQFCSALTKTDKQHMRGPERCDLGKKKLATHGNLGKVLQGTLLPGIVYEALSSAVKRIIRVGHVLHVAVLPGIFAGKMEEAGGAMVGENAPLVEFETSEGARQALAGLVARVRPDARRQGLGTGDMLWGARCGGLGLCL